MCRGEVIIGLYPLVAFVYYNEFFFLFVPVEVEVLLKSSLNVSAKPLFAHHFIWFIHRMFVEMPDT